MGAGGDGSRLVDLSRRRTKVRRVPTSRSLPVSRSHLRQGSARRRTANPFTKTARWLRGRLLDELREAGRAGVQIAGERGEHNEAAVAATINKMVSEGLAESLGGDRYRLPHRGD